MRRRSELLGLLPTTTISGQLVSGGGLAYLATGAIVDMSNAGFAGLRAFGLIDVRKQPYDAQPHLDRPAQIVWGDMNTWTYDQQIVWGDQLMTLGGSADRLGRSHLQPLGPADRLG